MKIDKCKFGFHNYVIIDVTKEVLNEAHEFLRFHNWYDSGDGKRMMKMLKYFNMIEINLYDLVFSFNKYKLFPIIPNSLYEKVCINCGKTIKNHPDSPKLREFIMKELNILYREATNEYRANQIRKKNRKQNYENR